MVAGISPTGPNISGLRLPPYWHFLPPGTCTTMGVGEGLGVTPYWAGDPSLSEMPHCCWVHVVGGDDGPSPDSQRQEWAG